MVKRKYTVKTQLHACHNQDIIDYFESTRYAYNQAVRKSYHVFNNTTQLNESSYNTKLQKDYNILNRTANSIIKEAKGRYNSIKELKKYELKQLERKIKQLETKEIPELVERRNHYSEKLNQGLTVQLSKQRNLRRKIVAKKNKLNRYKQQREQLKYQIETGKFKLCFGTKHLLKRDYGKFIERRDSQMTFVGAKAELSCNQQLQLTYNHKNNQFTVKLRKDFHNNKNLTSDDRYVYGQVYFNHHKQYLIQALREKNSPLTYKIIKQNGRYYLYCIFEIDVAKEDIKTRSSNGTIGIDFNKGFITVAETNQHGHLVDIDLLPYRFSAGNKTSNDMNQIIKTVIKKSIQTGKDICIENLNFSLRKTHIIQKSNQKYNHMLHSLTYRQFSDKIKHVAHRSHCLVTEINPAWTSWIAKQTYCPKMKLNTHVGAAYVIARRGQGYQDTVAV